MKRDFFVIGDIHGAYDMLEKLLLHWDKNSQQLIFLGDLADRGPHAKQVILKVMSLVEKEQAICVSGNHEDIFLLWLEEPEDRIDWYLRNGGQATLESLLYKGILNEESPLEIASQLKYRYPHIIQFFKERPLYIETDHYIFVHAGVNLALENWHDTSKRDFIWIREDFHKAVNKTGKTILFGHTPTPYLHYNQFNHNLWVQPYKIGIDGGAVYEGVLHGVVLNEHGITANYQICHPNKQWHNPNNNN